MRRQTRQMLVLALALAACAPAAAEAGTYHVYACTAAGTSWGNGSWTGPLVPGLVVDTDCTASGSLIGLRIDGGKPIANGASAALTFTSPPGTTIADFALDRHLDFRSNPPLENTRPLYALYLLGGVPFIGAGDYHHPTRERLKAFGAWYGYPAANATLSRRTTSLRQFGALAGYKGDATTLSIQVGCFKRNTDCSAPAGGRVYHVLYGIDVTINDPQPPVPTVSAEGLLAGGPRNGSDPVVLRATDNTGIRRVELHDVTVAGAPQLVGAEDYTAAKTDAGATCSARLAKTCPELARETVRPTALQVGRRLLLVRTIDAGGNATDRGPYPVDVATPSDRGPLNGVGATETGTLTARFRGGEGQVKTARYGRKVRIAGRLLNAIGQPVGGAEIDLVTTNKRRGATPRQAQVVPHGGRRHLRGQDGSTRLAATAARVEVARQRHALRGERRPDAADAGGGFAQAVHAPPAGRRPADAARATASAGARGHGHPPGPQGRRRALLHVRRHHHGEERPLQGDLPLPRRGLPRQGVQVPRQAPRRQALPVRDGVLAPRRRARPLSARAYRLSLADRRHRGRGNTCRATS